MIDVVIALGKGSFWDDNEIRYCLRSIQRHLKWYDNVFVIGECPDFLTNVIHIPAKDDVDRRWKDRNIYRKLLMAVKDDRVSDKFLFINDDHYIIADIEASEIPYYFRERDMLRTITITKSDLAWKQSLVNTREYLHGNNCDVKMFDMHTPIVYEKSKFLKLKELDWDKEYGYGIKSLYCNINRIEGELKKDNRLFPRHTEPFYIHKRFQEKPFISTSPEIPQVQKDVLTKLFNNKSIYEQ